eukprot:jgi/Botrbrau1/6893/Bobra.67_3s0012.1
MVERASLAGHLCDRSCQVLFRSRRLRMWYIYILVGGIGVVPCFFLLAASVDSVGGCGLSRCSCRINSPRIHPLRH